VSEDDPDPRPPRDGLAFNDPAGWGYCDYCALDVAVADGVRIEHRLVRNGHQDALCAGSDKPPAVSPGAPDGAVQRRQISFQKDRARQHRRALWQEARWQKRAEARGEDVE
jgi:hypothetical protein